MASHDVEKSQPISKHENAELFDMFVLIGMLFNLLIVLFLVLFWLDLL